MSGRAAPQGHEGATASACSGAAWIRAFCRSVSCGWARRFRSRSCWSARIWLTWPRAAVGHDGCLLDAGDLVEEDAAGEELPRVADLDASVPLASSRSGTFSGETDVTDVIPTIVFPQVEA